MSYGDTAQLNFDLNDYTTEQEIVNKVPGLRWFGGQTNTPVALRLARTGIFSSAGGDRSNVNDLCILLTDGGTSEQWVRINLMYYNCYTHLPFWVLPLDRDFLQLYLICTEHYHRGMLFNTLYTDQPFCFDATLNTVSKGVCA